MQIDGNSPSLFAQPISFHGLPSPPCDKRMESHEFAESPDRCPLLFLTAGFVASMTLAYNHPTLPS